MAEEGPKEMELVEVKADDILPERRGFYDSFMGATKVVAGATVAVLVLMWIFLV